MPEKNNEIVCGRNINCPVERVFNSFSDPGRLAQWWGPKGFTNTFHKFEFRPLGKWEFVMHGPNGVNYKNDVPFVDIEPLKKIVIQRISEPVFRMEMTFEAQNERTQLAWRAIPVKSYKNVTREGIR